MKKIAFISILFFLSLAAQAQVPRDLQDLIPAGKNDLRLVGHTQDNKQCVVDFSALATAYEASLAVLDNQGAMITRRFGSFQIGLGHDLLSFQNHDNVIVAVALHRAEEGYSHDSRATLKVTKAGPAVKSVQVIDEDKGFFGFSTRNKETCLF